MAEHDVDGTKLDMGDDLPPETTDEATDTGTDTGTDSGTDTGTDTSGAGKAAGGKKGGGGSIPAYRVREMVEKERGIIENERAARAAAEKRLADLEALMAQKTADNERDERLSALEEKAGVLSAQHAQYVVDGNIEEAAKVMRQIRAIDREIARDEVMNESRRTASAAVEAERVKLAVARLEAEHPVLNPVSEEYDPSVVGFVLSEQARLIGEGVTPSDALLQAGADIINRFIAPRASAAVGEGLSQAAAGREAERVRKNLAASAAQPASLKNVGTDSDKAGQAGSIDVTALTPEEYDALPDATKQKLRGDYL